MRGHFNTYPILAPASWLYRLGTGIRNRLYDKGLKSSVRFDIPVISIGNITAGGTGKTPHTEYLIRLLQNRLPLAVLSRGYGRRTSGFLYVREGMTSSDAGDEPCQMHRTFPDVTVAVCEDRAEGINILKADAGAVLLDDAFQHRSVTPSLNILLVNYNRNILDDRVIPAGLLRESPKGRCRADIIVMSKCPADLSVSQMEACRQRMQLREGQLMFFSTLEYSSLRQLDGGPAPELTRGTGILVATGIASPSLVKAEMDKYSDNVKLMRFADHHDFTGKDLERMLETLDAMPCPNSIMVVTEKDAARLASVSMPKKLRERTYVLPVKVRFLEDGNGNDFDKCIINHIESFNGTH